ncbi:MAG: hypothetical protein HKN38_02075, partial [Altererythrobacter sp.]|nr:hypothetical protein [Altererythrobacter sp.]
SAVPFEARQRSGPLFRADEIVLQPLHVPVVTFSAAMTAYIEAHFDDDNDKNLIASPGPLTDTPATFPYAQMISMMNRGAWSQKPEIMAFLARSRLDNGGPVVASLMTEGSPKLAVLEEFREAAQKHMPDLIRLGMQAKAIHEAG